MRDRWFADDRDLVKWATLVEIARQRGLASITQVAYQREGSPPPTIELEGQRIAIDSRVWRFFRDLARIRLLGAEVGVAIDVVDEYFAPSDRPAYLRVTLRHLANARTPRLVFLDPDTGLEPRRATAHHATRDEVRACWTALTPGECLVLYQHARRTKTWTTDVAEQLRNVCDDGVLTFARSSDVGRDVAFFCLTKLAAD